MSVPIERSVLVAEQDEVSAMVLCWALERLGVSTWRARSGFEALEMIRSGGVRLLITELRLPDVDGIELTRSVRRDLAPSLRSLPILAVTTEDREAALRRCGGIEIDGLLPKPYDLDELLAHVERLLSGERRSSLGAAGAARTQCAARLRRRVPASSSRFTGLGR